MLVKKSKGAQMMSLIGVCVESCGESDIKRSANQNHRQCRPYPAVPEKFAWAVRQGAIFRGWIGGRRILQDSDFGKFSLEISRIRYWPYSFPFISSAILRTCSGVI